MNILKVDVRALELFLKKVQHGPEAMNALRYRTAIHYLDPSLDRLSSRMLEAYEKLCTIVQEPFSILDAGCMAGYLRHFMQLRLKDFTYTGLDMWDEALQVAREFQPDIDVRKCDIMKDELPQFSSWSNGKQQRGFDYVWCSNIVFDNPSALVEKLKPLARRKLIIAQPPWAGEYPGEQVKCGETTMYLIES